LSRRERGFPALKRNINKNKNTPPFGAGIFIFNTNLMHIFYSPKIAGQQSAILPSWYGALGSD